MSTPLTDAINALTTYANEVTGESDTTLSDAVASLVSGYGGGGGFNVLPYAVNLESLFRGCSCPSDVVLDFTGNTTLVNLATLAFNSTGLKNLTIKNLISQKTNVSMSALCYLSADIETITFENCSFSPSSLESLGRSTTKLTTISGELDCTNCTSVNSLNFWFASNNIIRDFRIKPNTIGHSLSSSMGGSSTNLSNATYISIANGLNPNVTGQTIIFSSAQMSIVQTIMGTNNNGIFEEDAQGTLALSDFITTVKGWTLST